MQIKVWCTKMVSAKKDKRETERVEEYQNANRMNNPVLL